MSTEHVQQQILDGLVAALVAANTAAAGRVFLDLTDPLRSDQLPALKVAEAPAGEKVDAATVSGRDARVYSVLITCVVAGGDDFGRRARALGLEVEKVLSARTLAVPLPGRAAIAAARITFDGDGDERMAQREQLWQFSYFNRRGAPDVAL